MGQIIVAATLFVLSATLTGAWQNSSSDEAGRILGLENAWNHALEAKDSMALDMVLANTFVSVDIDGSISSSNLLKIQFPLAADSAFHVYRLGSE